MNYRTIPKVELHLHLDCGLSYEVVKKIAPGISEALYKERFIAPAKCHNLADFLTRAVMGYALMQTKEQLEWVVADLFAQLAADNTLYAEIRFAPLQHVEQGLTAVEVVDIVEKATAAAITATGVAARLILCTLRHFTTGQSMETVQLVHRFAGTTVAGFDIAADEAGFGIEQHIPAFNYAHAHGLHVTAHAGEARGADSVWETLTHFTPSRIGHGVRSIEDPALLEHIKQQRIHLEICPSCNVQIDIYNRYSNHPVDDLYRRGISLSINTDAPTIVNITKSQEYQKLHDTFGWTAQDFYNCNREALLHAFVDEPTRQGLLQQLEDKHKQWENELL
jgi:adenosine deaminase